jgi:hypothetical protein
MNSSKWMKGRHVAAGAVLLAGLLVVLRGAGLAQIDNREGTPGATQLEGTWRVRVTMTDCQTGVPGSSFQTLFAVFHGGGAVDTTDNAAFQPGQRTTSFGAWTYLGQHTFRHISEAFIVDSPAQPLAMPVRRGRQRLIQMITVQNDLSFTSNAAVEFFDTSGTSYLTGCSTWVGTRMQ